MNLLPLLVLRWLHLGAAFLLFGAALFPAYAPTGRSLDRPLRLVVRVAAVFALVTAMAETGVAKASLPRLALLIFAGLICLSLRRNSWTARIQARVLAAVAGMALASGPLAWMTPGQPATDLAIQAAALVALGVWLGGLAPLYLLVAKTANAVDRDTCATALRRSFTVASCAAGVFVALGIAETLAGGPSWVLLRFAQFALVVCILGLAAIDRFAFLPQPDCGASTIVTLRRSVGFQGFLALLLIGSVALLWASPAGR